MMRFGKRQDPNDWAKEAKRKLGQALYDQIVHDSDGLVFSIVRGYVSPGSNLWEDMMQAGRIGVLRAMNKYDPERGYRFATFAQHHIREECLQVLRNNNAWSLSRASHGDRAALLRARTRLQQDRHDEPTLQELAQELGWDVTDVKKVISNLDSEAVDVEEAVDQCDDADTAGQALQQARDANLMKVVPIWINEMEIRGEEERLDYFKTICRLWLLDSKTWHQVASTMNANMRTVQSDYNRKCRPYLQRRWYAYEEGTRSRGQDTSTPGGGSNG